jgi:hypothetical protein
VTRHLRAVAILAALLVATTGGTAHAAGKQNSGTEVLTGRIVFYNGSDGSGEIGKLDNNHQYPKPPLDSLPPGASTKGLTHAVTTVDGRILWYKSTTGELGIGGLTSDNHHITVTWYVIDSFPKGWTHIVSITDGRYFIYNSTTGAGLVGQLTPLNKFVIVGTLPNLGSWTHVTAVDRNRILFYKSTTGAASIGQLLPDNSYQTLGTYPDGSFAFYSHITSAADGTMLFYSAFNGAGLVGRFDSANQFVTLSSCLFGCLPTGFTHLVPLYEGRLFWYTQSNGGVAVTRLAGGLHTVLAFYPADYLPRGWSLIPAV